MIKKLLQAGILLAAFVSVSAGAVPDLCTPNANAIANASANGLANGKAFNCVSTATATAVASTSVNGASKPPVNGVGVPTVKVSEPSLVGLLAMGLIAIGVARRFAKS